MGLANPIAAADYAKIDAHALSAPPHLGQSPAKLAAYLVGPAQNELEKVRSLFRWITENIGYDVENLRAQQPGALDPAEVLAARRAVCGGYANLFEHLAQLSGLKAVTINGFSKGYDYQAGQAVGPNNHAWNAVQINGVWHLLDPTWGAGGLWEGRWKKQLDEGYFLTAPTVLIYTHLPEDPYWQLLEQPVKRQVFERMVHLKPHFFAAGLALGDQVQGLVEAEDEVQINLVGSNRTLVKAVLRQKGQELPETLALAQRLEDQIQVGAVFPRPGEYILRLFAKIKEDPGPYQWALDYKIKARRGSDRVGFPQVYQTFATSGAYLYAPRQRYLPSSAALTFKIRVPQAIQVGVVQNDHWQFLKKVDNLYQGTIKIAPGPLGVYAKFPHNKAFAGLLQYIGD